MNMVKNSITIIMPEKFQILKIETFDKVFVPKQPITISKNNGFLYTVFLNEKFFDCHNKQI